MVAFGESAKSKAAFFCRSNRAACMPTPPSPPQQRVNARPGEKIQSESVRHTACAWKNSESRWDEGHLNNGVFTTDLVDFSASIFYLSGFLGSSVILQLATLEKI
jgi:hypothetical protein